MKYNCRTLTLILNRVKGQVVYFEKSVWLIGQGLAKMSGPNILLIKLLCKASATQRNAIKKRRKTLNVKPFKLPRALAIRHSYDN